MQTRLNIKQIWDKVVDQVKLKIIHPTLWRTLELTIPITVENNEFVVGFAPKDLHLSGHLVSSDHKNAIEKALREFSGVPLSLRIIEGDTLQDWEAVKVKDEHLQEFKEVARLKKDQEAALTKSWDGLTELVGRSYAATPLRQLPQFRAQYIEEMLQAMSDTIDILIPDGSPTNEIAERSLARVIERVATLTETPAAVIALELARFRKNRK